MNHIDDDFEAMLAASEQTATQVSIGDRVNARVIRTGRDYLFLDLGTRDEGLLMREEATDKNGDLSLEVGDTVSVYVTAFRDGAVLCGRTIGSGGHESKADDKAAVFETLKNALDSGMPIEGTVKESVKGGFSVRILGQRAFCPISQIDRAYCESPDEHLNRTYQFQITKLEEGGRNIVVSRRKFLELEAEEAAARMWQELQVGQSYTGRVTSIKPYGAFVDLGGVEGLIHVSELGYDRVRDPSDVLSKDQEVTVSIKELDRHKNRISLSLKALMDDPWNEVAESVKVNQVLAGRVTRTAQFGAFVELMPGVEGLVHISQLTAEKRVRSPLEVVSADEEVTVRVLEVDPVNRRISLTMILEKEEDEDWGDVLRQSNRDVSGSMGTLGDLLKKK